MIKFKTSDFCISGLILIESAAGQEQYGYCYDMPRQVRVTDPLTHDPVFQTCARNCPTTSQHSPVCSTHNKSYQNKSYLECDRQCGLSKYYKKNW